ncbi:hypothetical protein [Methylobacterium nodulans]|uniref:hypothetical protein n=1 Tax=Methylobacterium nodulans TaxID=114616 RepID=UPI0005C15D63|nr:hypothetical protein [Methylobacterium nodulans]
MPMYVAHIVIGLLLLFVSAVIAWRGEVVHRRDPATHPIDVMAVVCAAALIAALLVLQAEMH